MIDIEKFYKVGKRMVGSLNKDLVHHCYIEYTDSNYTGVNPEGYFWGIMLNQSRKNSRFSKMYNTLHNPFEPTTPELNYIDTVKIARILKDIASDGYNIEVQAFIDIVTDKNMLTVNKLTGARREKLKEICTFVATETKQRYESDNN